MNHSSEDVSTTAKRYRKKPVVIEAMQWTGGNIHDLWNWASVNNVYGPTEVNPLRLYVAANNAWLDLEIDEWIIKDARGFYPCKADIFADTYEPEFAVRAEDLGAGSLEWYVPHGHPADMTGEHQHLRYQNHGDDHDDVSLTSIGPGAKPVEPAIVWTTNGDHPEDRAGEPTDEYPGVGRIEGAVVRFFRHPNYSGTARCEECGCTYDDHGWLDSGGDGHKVCPGTLIADIDALRARS